jgi:hypothetical protein
LAEWLCQAGIGEVRAALVEQGRIVEMALEWDDDGPRAGTVASARLTRRADASGRGLVTLADGTAAQLAPVPPGLTEGAALMVEIVREALPEAERRKPPRARPASEMSPGPGPDLLARIAATGMAVRDLAPADDALETLGWSEHLEEAASGIVATPALMLRIALTPAMTVIDVDGAGGTLALAVAGARVAGEAIRRFDITGSIGIDLPTLGPKADRQAAAAALDAVLPPPFERTAVNGFGFLQVVRRRVRPSLMERLAADPLGLAARALLRRGARCGGRGALTLVAAPVVIDRIVARPDWIDALATRAGAPVALREETDLPISAGHAVRAFP